MKRESGWYWVRFTKDREWQTRYYNQEKKRWVVVFGYVKDEYWAVIHHQRIKSPDEL